MKTKNLFISNFKFNQQNKNNDNLLNIEEYFNVNTNNENIQTELSLNNILYELYDSNLASNIIQNNEDILSKTIKIIPYEFFNDLNVLKQIRLFAISSDEVLYELNYETNNFEEKYIFNKFIKDLFIYNVLYLFDSNNKCLVIEENNIISVENIPTIKSCCQIENTLYFSIENYPNKFYFGQDIQIKDLSIYLEQYSGFNIPFEDGEIYKLANLKNQIFIFTQYSIYKFDIKEFKLSKQNMINSFIYKNSITQLDDYIVFFASNGLYRFDGNDLKLIFNNWTNLSKSANFVCFNENLYILPIKNENKIFKYNLNFNQLSVIKIDNVDSIYKISNYSNHTLCICYKQDDAYKIDCLYSNTSQKHLNQYVKFYPAFFNSNNLKQIKSIIVNSTGDFNLKINSNISSTSLDISNQNYIYNLDLSGNYFIFEISSNSKFRLNSILLTYNEIGE